MVQNCKNKNDLQDILDVRSKTIYEYYKANRKKTSPTLPKHESWATCANMLLKSIGNLLVEKEGGVMVNDVGYFAYIMIPKKTRTGFIKKSKFIYKPYFFGFGDFKDWTLQDTFIFNIKNPNRINQEKKRELHYTLFNNLKIKI